MTEVQEFRALINRMQCAENVTRKEAESQYDQIPVTTKGQLLFQLFMDQTVDNDVRVYFVLSVLFALCCCEFLNY